MNIKRTIYSQSGCLSWLIIHTVFLSAGGVAAGAIALLDAAPALAKESSQASSVQVAESAPLSASRPLNAFVQLDADSGFDFAAGSDARPELDSRIPQDLFEPQAESLPPLANAALADRIAADARSTNPVARDQGVPNPTDKTVRRAGSDILGQPTLQLQGVYKQEGGDSSARARLTGLYPVTPDILFGAVVDWSTGRGFSDSPDGGFSLSELYMAVSPPGLPRFRLIGGLMDYTSYFDRNSFAKDGASHFFNRVFQTNPALSAAGLASRIGLIANWSPTDDLDIKGGVFSSRRSLGSLALDGSVVEVDWRIGTLILGGTYISAEDAGRQTGFEEIFQFDRGNGNFGLSPGDRESAYGFNAEYYLPQLHMGFFGRYGRYTNDTLEESGDTYSFGTTFLDLFRPRDRLGIGYGRQLSNNDLRRQRDDKRPDVLEVYYDMPISPNLRGAVMVQARDQFSDIIFGVRLKTEINLIPLGAPRP